MDFFRKLYILACLIWQSNSGAWDYWKDCIYKTDLDSTVCCDGNMCGCRGATIRDEWFAKHEKE